MGHRNTGSKSGKRSLKSYIRSRVELAGILEIWAFAARPTSENLSGHIRPAMRRAAPRIAYERPTIRLDCAGALGTSTGSAFLCFAQRARTASLFSRKQPFERLSELSTDSKQNLCPNLDAPVLSRRKVALTNANPLCEFLLRHVKPPQLPNPSAYCFPVNRGSLCRQDSP